MIERGSRYDFLPAWESGRIVTLSVNIPNLDNGFLHTRRKPDIFGLENFIYINWNYRNRFAMQRENVLTTNVLPILWLTNDELHKYKKKKTSLFAKKSWTYNQMFLIPAHGFHVTTDINSNREVQHATNSIHFVFIRWKRKGDLHFLNE